MVFNKKFSVGLRFLFVSAIIIVSGMAILDIYDINLSDELQQEIRNLNILEEVMGYFTLWDDKILSHINVSALPLLYTFGVDDPDQAILMLLYDVLTINIVFSELYHRITRYDKNIYSKPVRLIFNLVGIVTEFALTYCSYAFLVFLSLILPDDLGIFLSSNFFTKRDNFVAFLLSMLAYGYLMITIWTVCFIHLFVILIICVIALVIEFFHSDYNSFSSLFIILGLLSRWLLGDDDACNEARKEMACHFSFPILFLLTIIIILSLLINAIL